jgi:hypothetical protein
VSDAILADPVSYLGNPQDFFGKALQLAMAEYQNPKDFNALLYNSRQRWATMVTVPNTVANWNMGVDGVLFESMVQHLSPRFFFVVDSKSKTIR